MTDAGKRLPSGRISSTLAGQWVPRVPLGDRIKTVEADVRAAIEAEAIATERARIRPWVESVGHLNLATGKRITKRDVLAIIEGADDA